MSISLSNLGVYYGKADGNYTLSNEWNGWYYYYLTVNLGVTMPNNYYTLVCTAYQGGNLCGVSVADKSTTSFKAYIYRPKSSATLQTTLYWVAIR